MLKGKYIKYSSEITIEVFEKIWDKLTSLGWKCADSNNAKDCYRDFSGDYPYLREDDPKEFVALDSPDDTSEISYKEFLVGTKSSKDLMLEKARREYPAGTKIKSVYSGDTFILNSSPLTVNSAGNIMGEDRDSSSTPVIYLAEKNAWSEIIISKEEILAKALKDYPIGTTFISSFSGGKFTIEKQDFSFSSCGDLSYDNRGIVYDKGKNLWSKIVPVEKPKLKVSVGDTVRVTKEKISSNKAAVGYVGKVDFIDSSDVPYCVDGSWCVDVELVDVKEPESVPISKNWWETLKNGDYVVSLEDHSGMRTKDFVYKISEQTTGNKHIRYIRDSGSQGGTDEVHTFRRATFEEAELYKKAGKPCSIHEVVSEKKLPTDQELLDYANKHFVLGTKFISIVPNDGNKERTCTPYTGNTYITWEIGQVNTVRSVRARNGVDSKTGCSNPYIYTDTLGWAKITHDASKVGRVSSRPNYLREFNVGDTVLYCGEPHPIVAICYTQNYYIVDFPPGWEGSTNGYPLEEGSLNPSGKYHYAGPSSVRKYSPPSTVSYRFKVGDEVTYHGINTKVVAICDNPAPYIVEYASGWGTAPSKPIIKGSLERGKNHHYAHEYELQLISASLPSFKVGDWIYCERKGSDDHRTSDFVPIFEIREVSKQSKAQTWLRPQYGESTGILEKHCRLATQSEIDAYFEKKKITNTAIEYKGRCISVKTQEQWDIVTKRLGYSWSSGRWPTYKEDSVISLQGNWYGRTADYRGYEILSFIQFCQEFNVPYAGVVVDSIPAPKVIEDIVFISDTMEMPIKRKVRPLKKQTKIKFTNN